MGPSNEHETEIARIVDRISSQHRLSATAIDEVIARLTFTMTRTDSEFLVKYIRWRVDNPVVN